jgi:N utilization substance protein A
MNRDMMEALENIEREKGISTEIMLEALANALVTAYKRLPSSAEEALVEIDIETGDIRVIAQDLDEEGNVTREWDDTPDDFGRIAAQTAKQVILQRIREAEREMKYEEYAGREGDIVTGIIQQTDARYTLLDLGRVEALLPQAEQVQNERYEHGSRLKAYIVEVRKTAKGPQIVVSRTHPGLVKRLFELEVPEIVDGVVDLKAIAREPGHRTKIAVASNDNNVDPVGACVGARGSRVRMVVNELRGEKVDIVPYSENSEEFVMKALAPARVREVRIHPETGTAEVIVPDFQLSLAIGKEGQNARLAARLSGWRVDIKSETQLQEEESGEGIEYAEGEWVKSEGGELVWQPAGGGDAISAAEAGYAAPDPTVVAVKEGDGASGGDAAAAASGDKAAAAQEPAAESDAPATEAATPETPESEGAAEPAPAGEASEAKPKPKPKPEPATVPADGGEAVSTERGEDDSSRG